MSLKIILITLLILALLITATITYGKYRWQESINTLHKSMRAAQSQTNSTTIDLQEIKNLPAPVQRYFETVLKDGHPIVSTANITHTGTFNMGDKEEKWVAFDSNQHVSIQRPGFIWDARIHTAPMVSVFVNDAYIAGEGTLTAKVLGLFTVMHEPSTPELAQGELMRFFAEATWYPTALLPSQGVRWEAINDSQAQAMITDENFEIKLLFDFDEQGLISKIYSDGRYRIVDGKQVATPWQGHFENYAWRDNMLIPLDGEVAWLIPEGEKAYWRGHIQQITYEFAEP